MSQTIWKFELAVTDLQTLRMPAGSQILTVQTQNGAPMIWALVNPQVNSTEARTLCTFGTGHQINDDPREYVGTYQLNNGSLMFHVFEQRHGITATTPEEK